MRMQLPDQPFVYVVGWAALDTFYLGVRYRKGCQPSDLWTRYFTSSKYVAEFRKIHGEPDVVEVLAIGDREEVLAWEFETISDFSLHTASNWLNRNAGGRRFVSRRGHSLSEIEKEKRRGPRDPYGPRRRRPTPRKSVSRNKLTDQQVRDIRSSSETTAALARQYGLTQEAIKGARTRRSYKWVD